jgi:hypothetical protein
MLRVLHTDLRLVFFLLLLLLLPLLLLCSP